MAEVEDKHKLHVLSRVVGVALSAFFAAVGIAGYQRTQDVMQLLLFLGLAFVAFLLVKLLFMGIGRLLDQLDQTSK
ncbi:hypothetical protein [Nitrincola nitratireducens]|uniref:Uncharacterized protein n=1 Tax=Nitrincola nitratireducens TaxID=1229521 RepID=W9UPS5_9GAMM|nr:hypothetical protein [Nitrincola nitratireducens]EXJ09218.1 hypothetical protein D791_03864 [Nitrincola nitratireducens]